MTLVVNHERRWFERSEDYAPQGSLRRDLKRVHRLSSKRSEPPAMPRLPALQAGGMSQALALREAHDRHQAIDVSAVPQDGGRRAERARLVPEP